VKIGGFWDDFSGLGVFGFSAISSRVAFPKISWKKVEIKGFLSKISIPKIPHKISHLNRISRPKKPRFSEQQIHQTRKISLMSHAHSALPRSTTTNIKKLHFIHHQHNESNQNSQFVFFRQTEQKFCQFVLPRIIHIFVCKRKYILIFYIIEESDIDYHLHHNFYDFLCNLIVFMIFSRKIADRFDFEIFK
jgi:hypothetical protein